MLEEVGPGSGLAFGGPFPAANTEAFDVGVPQPDVFRICNNSVKFALCNFRLHEARVLQ